ncbi:MAG: AMP-binding protein, partial [Emcibacter sp.]|nr:AMP-binding protein [Emcibacter sp.]
MNIVKSDIDLGEYTPNVGTMFLNNRADFGPKPAFAERDGDDFKYWSWDVLTRDIIALSAYLLNSGLDPDDADLSRVCYIGGNSYKRLVCEMAIMSCGLTCVPIFAKYPNDFMEKLITFSEASMVIGDNPEKIASLNPDCLPDRVLLTPTAE